MFRFVSDNVGGVGTKRKQTHRPCESCKKRHKRCPHGQDDLTGPPDGRLGTESEGDASIMSAPGSASARATSSSAVAGAQPNGTTQASSASGPDQRPELSLSKHDGPYLLFFSDLIPASSFLDTGSSETDSNQRRGEVGIWLGQTNPDDHQSAVATDEPEVRTVTIEPMGGPAFRLTGLTGLKALYPYLRRECMCVLPPAHDYSLISKLYFAKFDPIYPILHGERLDEYEPLDQVVLKQCICLAASLDPSLKPHLKLGSSAVVLSQAEFRATVAATVKQSLDAGFVQDKMAILLATALMAFYTDKKHTSEVSTPYLAQAVCLTHEMALHLGWPGDGNSTPRSRRIYLCIWTLDRINAVFNGRAIFLHDQDNDDRVWGAVDEQIPSFRLFILICRFLDNTIPQYRPRAAETPQTIEFPRAFEDFVADASAGDIGNPLLVSLELFYLGAVIIYSKPVKTDSKSDRMPSSSLQCYCASSIISILTGEFKPSMSYWAGVPYTASLACSIAYKSLRNSSMSYKRKEAYTMFQSSCDILDELSKYFASAQTMARLAKGTLHEVERVSASRSKGKAPDGRREEPTAEEAHPAGPAATTDDVRPQPMVPRAVPRAEAAVSRHPETSEVPLAAEVPAMPLDANLFNEMDFTDVGGIFDDFDPNFQLNRVDAAFSANLNPTMPFFPADWLDDSQYGGFT